MFQTARTVLRVTLQGQGEIMMSVGEKARRRGERRKEEERPYALRSNVHNIVDYASALIFTSDAVAIVALVGYMELSPATSAYLQLCFRRAG
ncbi:MAG: hypothetical protein FRX48_00351 [Lasallia pustulata]|uniref:Uncharacterized protein n=1 Tax=Lasallia pustulata TaxID=136370 RepID=A0A5M8Q349_9LECA|nr:MAG: hypothetical protein FRX48_00351 [Lasallia pustulata]